VGLIVWRRHRESQLLSIADQTTHVDQIIATLIGIRSENRHKKF
jgi:hypothetical protein